jgi:delta 1-pyrroline-5-carboxylate dehydrogenase
MTEEQRRERAYKALAARKWHPMRSEAAKKAASEAAKKANGRPRVRPLRDPSEPKRRVGRPKLTEEEKAARALARAKKIKGLATKSGKQSRRRTPENKE